MSAEPNFESQVYRNALLHNPQHFLTRLYLNENPEIEGLEGLFQSRRAVVEKNAVRFGLGNLYCKDLADSPFTAATTLLEMNGISQERFRALEKEMETAVLIGFEMGMIATIFDADILEVWNKNVMHLDQFQLYEDAKRTDRFLDAVRQLIGRGAELRRREQEFNRTVQFESFCKSQGLRRLA